MSDERLEELEIKLAYQEQSIAQLSEALINQQRQIEQLQLNQKQLLSKVETLSDSGDSAQVIDEVPPHY